MSDRSPVVSSARFSLCRETGQVLRATPRLAGAAAITLVGGVLFVDGAPVSAATFQVTNTDDAGSGSFRQAVLDANAAAGEDTIDFALADPSTITLLTRVDITDDLRIVGPGRTALTLTNPTGDVLYVGTGSLYVSALTINDVGDDSGDEAILVKTAGDLTVNDVAITLSVSQAVYVDGGGSIAIIDSDITGSGDQGLYIDNVAGVTITGSDISNNDGHNIYLSEVSGDVIIQNSTVSDSGSYGIYINNVLGSVQITDVVANGNDGSNIWAEIVTGGVTLTRVTGNGSVSGGGTYLRSIIGEVLFDSSTFANNDTYGIELSSVPDAVIRNTTISANASDGVTLFNSSVSIEHSTVVDNGGAGVRLYGSNAGITHSIVSGNVNGAVFAALSEGINTYAVDHSLVPVGSGFAGAGNVEADDPVLGPLQNNGGSTDTHLPMSGSPAIDAGDPVIATPPATDQRGSARVVNLIDIGAVEVNPGQVDISPVAVSVDEAAGTVAVTVTRSGGFDGAVSVLLSTANGTALAPGDYATVSQVVSFADGVSGPQVVNVVIADDAMFEPTEVFTASLSAPTGGVVIGAALSTVTITDNDVVPTTTTIATTTTTTTTATIAPTTTVPRAVVPPTLAPTIPATGASSTTTPIAWIAGVLLAVGAGLARLTRRTSKPA